VNKAGLVDIVESAGENIQGETNKNGCLNEVLFKQ
jgi:hypothetical protein